MKRFEMTVTLDDDGRIVIDGTNNGFNALELIGFLEAKKQDIIEQINHPERFTHKRVAVVDGEQISIEEVEDNAED